MPANAHYFILNFLNLVRLNISALNEQLDSLDGQMSDYELSKDQSNFYSESLHFNGYSFNLVRNLIILICIGATIAMIWVITALISLCKAKVGGQEQKATSEQFMNNVMVRFGYEVFFELMICALLTVSSPQASGPALWISGLAILAVAGFSMIALSTCFCGKGPFTESEDVSGAVTEQVAGTQMHTQTVQNTDVPLNQHINNPVQVEDDEVSPTQRGL